MNKEDEYVFGNADQSVRLLILSEAEHFELKYFDEKLERLALDEWWDKERTIEGEQKAELKKKL